MPGPALTEADRETIRNKLIELCKHHWTAKGYKKTSIQELCADAKIGISTFYSLYPAKEDLFRDTTFAVRDQLEKRFIDTFQRNPTIEGFAQALKEINREHDKIPFTYDVNTPDFLSFITKLSEEAMEELKSNSIESAKKLIRLTNLKYKIDEQKAFGVLNALMHTIDAKESISEIFDYFTVFDFMVDSLIPDIFEEERET